MRAAISEDWTGEPPGELITSATAEGLPLAKAFSISGASPWSLSAAPRLEAAIAPFKRMTATRGGFLVKGSLMACDVEPRMRCNKAMARNNAAESLAFDQAARCAPRGLLTTVFLRKDSDGKPTRFRQDSASGSVMFYWG